MDSNRGTLSNFSVDFLEVSNAVGITQAGESWGVAWSDFDGDQLPDLWVTNHLTVASLFQTSGDSGFTDTTSSVFSVSPTRDFHGSAWADFDNDGDQDLIVQTASDNGRGRTELFVNNNGTLLNQAAALGVDTPARGRMPLWFDYNRDSRLDLVIAAGAREIAPPTVFEQTEQSNSFVSANVATGFDVNSSSFSSISDLNGDGVFELIIDGGKRIFDTSTVSFQDETSTWLPNGLPSNVADALTADFNGDLRPDLFLVNSRDSSDLVQPDSNSLQGLLMARADQKGIEFNSDGSITIEMPTLAADQIFIGSSGANPSANRFTLSASDASNRGFSSYSPGVNRGAYIGYDTAAQKWQIFWSSPNTPGKSKSQYLFIESDSAIANVTTVGFDPNDQALPDQLLVNTGATFVDLSAAAGLSHAPTFTKNAVAADFDNDMDLDIYAVATSLAGNRSNILYENQGDGTFVLHEATANAGETTLGLADSASAVDYDLDGFVDIFTTNGNFFLGYGNISRAFYNDGPYQLFKNLGNNNHWLQLDLQGVASNRDGIGAKVYATAGGITQLREQNGGIHNKSQNHQRIHFGLAQNDQVNKLEVQWSSGIEQQHRNVAADQLITLIEGQGLDGNDRLTGNDGANVLKGLGGRDVLDGKAGDDTLLGGADPDRLIGNDGNDRLEGGDRGDFLVGGEGNDMLLGGNGRDKFRFNSLREGIDTILDFTSQKDSIQIKGSKFGGNLSKGILSNDQFTLGTTATEAFHRVIYDSGSGNLFFDPDGVGGQGQTRFAVLEGSPTLAAADMRVV